MGKKRPQWIESAIAQSRGFRPAGGHSKNIIKGCEQWDEESAALAYDAFARENFGEFARLNFPEPAP